MMTKNMLSDVTVRPVLDRAERDRWDERKHHYLEFRGGEAVRHVAPNGEWVALLELQPLAAGGYRHATDGLVGHPSSATAGCILRRITHAFFRPGGNATWRPVFCPLAPGVCRPTFRRHTATWS